MTGIGYRYLAASAVFAVVLPIFAAAASPCPYTWNTNLSLGATGADVLALQELLNQVAATSVSTSGPGSPGMETSRFGAMTKSAVARFQEKYAADILTPNGLVVGNGFVGASTRAKLNALCASVAQAPQASSGSVLGASTTSDTLTVGSPEQPAQTIAPQNALYVPFTNIVLTAGSKDVTVSKVVVERVGPGSDQSFYDADLMNADSSYVSTAFFQADHKASFIDALTIPAHTSMNLTVYGDMQADLSSHNGEMPYLQVDAIDASSPVTGLLPIRGTGQITNSSLIIGSANATLSPLDPNASRTRYINDTGIAFSGIRINAGGIEDLLLDSMTWNQTGTAATSDVANISTIINGTAYPTTLSDDGRYYTSTFTNGIVIQKGTSLDLGVRGDLLVSGANRTVKFDINQPTDIALYGTTYGYGIFVLPGGNTAMSGNSVFLTQDGSTGTANITPFFSGSPVMISSGVPTYIGR